MDTLNAQIKSTKLGFISNGIFDFTLVLDIQGGGDVAFGGWTMDQYDKDKGRRVGTAYGMNVTMRILEVVGVNTWEELKGKYIRIKHTKLEDRVFSIGNHMKEEWIDFYNYSLS